MPSLCHSVTLYVPGTVNADQPMADGHHDAIVRDLLTIAAGRFGGATAIPGLGSYVAENGSVVIERVTLIRAAYCGSDCHAEDWARDQAAELADRLGQESVTVDLDGTMEFIKADRLWPADAETE